MNGEIHRIYMIANPVKIQELPELFSTYSGQETTLLGMVKEKYAIQLSQYEAGKQAQGRAQALNVPSSFELYKDDGLGQGHYPVATPVHLPQGYSPQHGYPSQGYLPQLQYLQPPVVQASLQGRGVNHLSNFRNLFVKQTKKGCLRNICGCEAATEAHIATLEHRDHNQFYVREESDCMMRLLCPGIYPFVQTISPGHAPGGPPVVRLDRPCSCHSGACKCCCYQTIDVFDTASNRKIGTTKENCWLAIPSFDVIDETGRKKYEVFPPICCGCCIDICKEGLCSCRFPFYIYQVDPSDPSKLQEHEIGKIVEIWSGLGNEVMGVHQFEIEFPKDATPEIKGNLLGTCMLLNEIFFKRHKN